MSNSLGDKCTTTFRYSPPPCTTALSSSVLSLLSKSSLSKWSPSSKKSTSSMPTFHWCYCSVLVAPHWIVRWALAIFMEGSRQQQQQNSHYKWFSSIASYFCYCPSGPNKASSLICCLTQCESHLTTFLPPPFAILRVAYFCQKMLLQDIKKWAWPDKGDSGI